MIDDGRINAVQLDLKDEGCHLGDDSQIPLAQEIGAAIGPLHLDIAEEAAAAGVDHILWDYIRRPEGLDNYTVPGLETTPEEAIVEFTRLAGERLD